MNMAGYTEVEIKLRVANVAAVRRRFGACPGAPYSQRSGARDECPI